MSGRSIETHSSWRVALASGALLGLVFAAGPAMSTNSIDPEADKILRSMSTYLGGLSTFSAKADIDTEIIDLEGQKIQLSSSTTFAVERPEKLNVRRQGVLADIELTFDGHTLTLYGKERNAYFQKKAPGTIDDVIDAISLGIGFDAPAADLIHSNSYAGLASGVTSSNYLGTAYVNGIESHHLIFREAKVDWQVWVKVGDQPLPMKYIITTKWLTGAPQHAVRFREWNAKPKIEADRFTFTAPKGATKLETISVDEMGEPSLGRVQ